MHFNYLYIISLLISLETVISDKLPTCLPENFKYDFTECDEFGGRWRVSVPSNPNACTGGAPNAPIRVDKCFTSCDFGQFFNSSSLFCQKCEPGYYSLGGGVHIQSFNSTSLPLGFHINTEPVRHSCIGWHINSNDIESTSMNSVGGCVSIISYTIKIVKKGKLRFTYQYFIPDDLSAAILFTFHYRNYDESEDISSSSLDANNIKFPTPSNDQQKWKTMEVKLMKPGLYFFVWKSVTLGHIKSFPNSENIKIRSVGLFDDQTDNHSNYGLIRIKSIYVDGVAYASECTPCESGTFNNKTGAEYCDLCPANTAFAGTGAIKCQSCDSQTQYSPKGSNKCLPRPICGENDYYEIIGECDLINKFQDIKYNWIEPKICRDENKVLPHIRRKECNESTFNVELNQKCNLGMELKGENCEFCELNKYRDLLLDNCMPCPPSSSPLYALSYKIWQTGKPGDTSLPPYFSTQCVRGDNEADNECSSPIAWQSPIGTKTYIRTTPSALPGSYLILTLNIVGFRKQTGGEISFKFEVECSAEDNCEFLFMESKGKRSQQTTNLIHKWSDSNGINSFKYRIQQNTSLSFSWIFKRDSGFQSNAKLYEVLVTDTSIGGAIECTACPLGSGLNCLPCPFGQYLESDDSMDIERHSNKNRMDRNTENVQTYRTSSRCKRCPQNFIINSSLSFPIGIYNSCIPCGSSLIDDNGLNCYSNCNVIIDNDNYNLNQLKQPLIYKANPLFTAGGTQYFHLFNITLCGQPQQKSTCINNITSFGANNDETDSEEGINSLICRSTIIPDRDQIFATQSVSLGDELIGITRQTTYQNITVHPEFQTTNSDLHFYYLTRLPTVACRNGRRLTLTLRCAPDLEENMVISSPKQCPDGTCDGCNFHLLVRTKTAAACRLCRASDYETLIGECVNGFQQIHFVNPKGCIITPDGQITTELRQCSIIPRQVQIVIGLVSCLGIILLMLVVHFWRKNRSLEYKYCKLIENEKTADCCAEDDEEEDDEVDVVVQPKKHKEIGEKGYETIHLTKHDHDMI